MIVPGIQSLTALTLAGVFCHLVFTVPAIQRHEIWRQALVGLVLGVLVVFLGISAFEIEGVAVPMSAKPGPLVIAGYLGGPWGGAVAALISALYRIAEGGPLAGQVIGVLVHLSLVAVGMLVRFFLPPADWPMIPSRAIWALLGGFIVAQAIPILALGLFRSAAGQPGFSLTGLTFIFILGLVSILATWQVIALAYRMARRITETNALNERLGLALYASGMGFSDTVHGSGFTNFDARTLEICGLTDRAPGPVPMREFIDLLHPDDVDAFKKASVASGNLRDRPTPLDVRIFRKSDGALRHLHAHWTNHIDPETGELRVVATMQDLTDVLQMEVARDEARERLKIASEGFPGMIYQGIWSETGVVRHLYLSDNCKTYWGVEPQEAYDNPGLLERGKPPEKIAEVTAMMLENVRSGKPIYTRMKVPYAWIDFHGNATPLGDGTYRVDGVVVDVTNEVAARDEADRQAGLAHRAQRMESIGQLTGGIAHDFNNLLAVVMGNLELLEDEVTEPKQARMIDSALEASRRGAELTQGMLAFARRARLDPEPLDLNEVVRHAKNWMRRGLPATVEIEVSLLAGLWQVRLDAASIESALLNLLLNARDAMEGHGKLTIETANTRIDEAYIDSRDKELTPGRYVMLAVSDTGKGMDAETMAQIFDPFFTTKGPGKGSGIGLSMVEGFVKQSGGTVQVYSEPGEGTTFKLYFPATNAPVTDASKHVPDQAEDGLHGKRILLVEDDTAVREMLQVTLGAAGYQVTPAASGDEAMTKYQEASAFDLLITDIVMPGTLQGTGLARAVREMDPDLPMIFMSGYAAEATVHGNGLRPEDIRLMKPVPRAELLKAVRKAFGQS